MWPDPALAGKRTGNAPLVAESGLTLLEQRLATFLLQTRQRIHLERLLHQVEHFITLIHHSIGERRASLDEASRTVVAQCQALHEAIGQVK